MEERWDDTLMSSSSSEFDVFPSFAVGDESESDVISEWKTTKSVHFNEVVICRSFEDAGRFRLDASYIANPIISTTTLRNILRRDFFDKYKDTRCKQLKYACNVLRNVPEKLVDRQNAVKWLEYLQFVTEKKLASLNRAIAPYVTNAGDIKDKPLHYCFVQRGYTDHTLFQYGTVNFLHQEDFKDIVVALCYGIVSSLVTSCPGQRYGMKDLLSIRPRRLEPSSWHTICENAFHSPHYPMLVLVVGPTGVGKTTMRSMISQLFTVIDVNWNNVDQLRNLQSNVGHTNYREEFKCPPIAFVDDIDEAIDSKRLHCFLQCLLNRDQAFYVPVVCTMRSKTLSNTISRQVPCRLIHLQGQGHIHQIKAFCLTHSSSLPDWYRVDQRLSELNMDFRRFWNDVDFYESRPWIQLVQYNRDITRKVHMETEKCDNENMEEFAKEISKATEVNAALGGAGLLHYISGDEIHFLSSAQDLSKVWVQPTYQSAIAYSEASLVETGQIGTLNSLFEIDARYSCGGQPDEKLSFCRTPSPLLDLHPLIPTSPPPDHLPSASELRDRAILYRTSYQMYWSDRTRERQRLWRRGVENKKRRGLQDNTHSQLESVPVFLQRSLPPQHPLRSYGFRDLFKVTETLLTMDLNLKGLKDPMNSTDDTMCVTDTVTVPGNEKELPLNETESILRKESMSLREKRLL